MLELSDEPTDYEVANVAVSSAREEAPAGQVSSATSNWWFVKGWHDLDGADEVFKYGPYK